MRERSRITRCIVDVEAVTKLVDDGIDLKERRNGDGAALDLPCDCSALSSYLQWLLACDDRTHCIQISHCIGAACSTRAAVATPQRHAMLYPVLYTSHASLSLKAMDHSA